jgi:colanic acid biosynthesis protein WcaH
VLYRKIVALVPIVCVDLLVVDRDGRVLLLKRRDEPAKGLWWFPGGRVHLGETRGQSALRKLEEECGLVAEGYAVTEIFTADVMLTDGRGCLCHGVSTVFRARIAESAPKVTLDASSTAAEWRPVAAWVAEDVHAFVRRVLGLETC